MLLCLDGLMDSGKQVVEAMTATPTFSCGENASCVSPDVKTEYSNLAAGAHSTKTDLVQILKNDRG